VDIEIPNTEAKYWLVSSAFAPSTVVTEVLKAPHGAEELLLDCLISPLLLDELLLIGTQAHTGSPCHTVFGGHCCAGHGLFNENKMSSMDFFWPILMCKYYLCGS
jgi:hypothetical protein